MPGVRLVKKQIQKLKNKQPMLDPRRTPSPSRKNDKLKDALDKFKNFITSPTGIVTVIVLGILAHYAWKGWHAPEKK